MSANIEYNGWKNRKTWNVALWIQNDEPKYRNAKKYMSDNKGKGGYIPFILLMQDRRVFGKETADGVEWLDDSLDYKALNEMMQEL